MRGRDTFSIVSKYLTSVFYSEFLFYDLSQRQISIRIWEHDVRRMLVYNGNNSNNGKLCHVTILTHSGCLYAFFKLTNLLNFSRRCLNAHIHINTPAYATVDLFAGSSQELLAASLRPVIATHEHYQILLLNVFVCAFVRTTSNTCPLVQRQQLSRNL